MLDVLLILFLCYVGVFVFSLIVKNNSYADVLWGLGFVIITLCSYIFIHEVFLQHVVTLLLTGAWGARLCMHLGFRTLTKKQEDPRYNDWRKTWKNFYIRSFLQVYMLQMIFMIFIATPIWMIFFFSWEALNPTITLIGASIALFGFIYEVIADVQLQSFQNYRKKGEYLSTGLRSLHRYPQYFGESVFWFGVCIIAAQIHIIAFLGWGMITFTLIFLSGIAMTESRNVHNSAFQKYKENIPAGFFPNIVVLFKK